MQELIIRLETLRKRLNLTQDQFAKMGKTERTTYNNWVTGKSVPSTKFIYNLKHRRSRDIDLDWVFTGNTGTTVNEPSIQYNKSDCEEKLSLARQVIEAQSIAINELKKQVSTSVSKKPNLKLQYS